jgi:hypothetical protein
MTSIGVGEKEGNSDFTLISSTPDSWTYKIATECANLMPSDIQKKMYNYQVFSLGRSGFCDKNVSNS